MRNLKRYLSLVLIVAMVSSFAISTTAAAEDPGPGAEGVPAGLNYDQYPALKDAYKDYFMIGAVGPLAEPRSDLIKYHFNAYTPENEMKPQSMQNDKGTFTYDNLNNLLDSVTALSGDIELIGHTLAWHSQTPNWMWDAAPARYEQPGTFDRTTALANLRAHIDNVLGEFGDRLYSIDVVNEAIGTANPADWGASVNKGEGWALALGPDWVEEAFLEAAKVVDAHGWDTKLYYNDFGLDGEAKAQTVTEMVYGINEKYKDLRPDGKPLIEGIGMQGHYNSSTKPENVEKSIQLFSTLPGVSVSITELDMEWPNLGSLTPAQAVAQGQKYAQLFQIFKKYAAGSANHTDHPKIIERVTFWGSNDGNSWKSAGLPLLFNAPDGDNVTAKEALVAVLNPDTYLEENPIVDEPDTEPTKPIDGVYVYDTSKGDGYSGANIILGNNASAWPWSTAGADGKVAFTPEKNDTYRISVNFTSLGANGIRVRWLKDESNGGYTSKDSQVVNDYPYSADQVAAAIPAYFNSGISTGNSYTLVTEIKLDGSQAADGLIGNIAIRGGSGSNSFSINEIKVEKIGTGGAPDQLLVNWPEGLPKAGTEGVHVYATEHGDGYSGANIVLGSNASKWPWSTAGADGKVAFTPEKDATYRIAVNYTAMGTNSIRIRWIKDESNGNYTAADGAVVNDHPYSASQIAAAIPAYFNSGMVNAGTYTLTTEIKLDGSQPADGLIGNIAVRGGAGGNSFLINWIQVEKIGAGDEPDRMLVNWPEGIEGPATGPVIPPAGQTYDKYTPLKDVYKDFFTTGIFGAGEINALIHNFAEYAPGNEMKPESTQNVKGAFTYSSADNAFDNLAGKNPDMIFYGHTLAWHSQSPTWMWDAPPARYDQPGTFDSATALANLNSHIENVLEHFGGRLKGVDVVNEAIGTSIPGDWKASLAKGEGWYNALGWEWVEQAFLKAAEVVDSHPDWDVKLIYNDFGLDSPAKAQVVYEMVKDINERYTDVRPNGKPLIEVIGMQAHYNLNTSAANVENSIKLFATLHGVNVNITEMDIGTPPVGVLTSENENNQAMKYAELFQIYRKYAAGSANKTDNPKVIDRVSICGVRDATSGWRAGEFALLFSSDGLAKQALLAVLDPDAYLATHEYIEPETEPEEKPVDGVHVYDAGKGDGWSGANIVLGNDANAWPWSTAGADGKVAFTPEKDATYRLTFNYTAKGTTSIRVRWLKDETNGGYTDADGAVVNDHPYSADQIAAAIPAYFNSGMVNMGSYTLTTEIKLDASQPANGLIGNIAIRGGGGGNAFSINWIKVEKIGAGGAADELLVNWPSESNVIYYEGFENGNTLQQNGTATIGVTTEHAAAGTSSLSVAPTADNNYSGVSLRNDSLETKMLPGGKYKLTAKALSEKDATLGVRVETKDSAGKDTYGSVGSVKVNLAAGQWEDVSLEFAVPADHQSVSAIVFHNDAQISDFTFYLDEVKVQIISLPEPGEEPEEPEITQLLAFNFDDEAAQGDLFTAAASSEIEWINGAGVGKNDVNALKVTHIDGTSYTSSDNAVRLTLAEPLPAGGVYNISVWFYAPSDGNAGKGTLTGPGVVLNGEYGRSDYKLPSNFGTLPIDQWKEVNIRTPLMETALKTIDFRLVVNDAANHADVWRIDNIVISQVGELQEVVIPEWDLTLASIAETYKNHFLIGNVMSASQTTDADNTAAYKHHYNIMTPENDMKPMYLSSAKGVYNYTNADTLINWAQANNIKTHGHALVWHSQSAPWLTTGDDSKPLTRAEAKANLEEYINNVAGHFKGKVVSWDVVNEAFDGGSGIPTDWKTVLRKNSPGYLAYANGADTGKGESGADYIYDAFVLARLADPGATLYYNDYNETDAWKREAMALMAEDLNEKWKTDERNTEPGRLLVEGIGMQAHYWIQSLDPATVEASIARFAKAGVKISVSELDIPSTGTLTKEEETKQAELYAKLFKIYKKYASSIERITFWGKADSQSWRASGSPLLFDKTFAAKPAYYAVINPEGYLNPGSGDDGDTDTDSDDTTPPANTGGPGTVPDGNATVTIDSSAMNKAISEAKSGTARLTVQVAEGTRQLSVTIPSDLVNAAKDSNISQVEIVSDLASVVLPVALLDKAGADVELHINKVDNNSLSEEQRAKIGSNTVFDFNLKVGGETIGSFGPGQMVRVSVPYTLRPGEDPEQIVIYYLTDDGRLEVVKNGRFDAATGTVTFGAKHFSKYAAAFVQVGFKDTGAVAWANGSIDALAARGIVSGVSAGYFAPERDVTRAEFVQMLMQTLDLVQPGAESTFSDVKQGTWYFEAVASAQKLGIVAGLPDGSFGVNSKITRQDMVVMVARALRTAGITLDGEYAATQFKDAAAIAAYAQDAVAAMQKAGLISGMDNGVFAPQQMTTRAQAAVILNQLLLRLL